MQPLFFEKGLTDIVQYQCVLPGIKEHIKNNLYAFQPQTQIVPNESVQIFSCKNQTQEVQNVLKRIYYLIARLGYRYKDINVAFSSLDGYKEILERELASYNFSYYIDSSTSLLSTELGRFVTTMLEALEYNFMSTDVFALLNNYYFDMTSNEKNFLNCVISKYNLQGINWLTNTKLFKNDTYITNLAKDINIDYEQTLEKFYKKLQDIQNIFKNCKTSSDFVSIIKQAIQNFDIDSMHEKLMQSNQNNINNLKILEQVLPKLQQILQQIEDLDVDIEYTYAEFSRLLKESLDACKINLVPLSIDAIYFGDATASTFEKRKFMIIVGANYGQLPQIKQDVGLVSDREVDMLQEKYKLEPKVSDVNMRARLKAYELCLFGTEGLIIYYPLVTDGGEEMHISPMVQSLMQCLCVKENTPLCIINSDDLWSYSAIGDADVLMRMCGNTQSAEQFVLENLALASEKNFASIYTALKDVSNICKYLQITEQKFIKPNIKNLDFYAFNGENDKKCAKFSVTQLATYFDCPYKHFVERALKIQQLQGANLDQLDIGTILHKYAELFEKELMQNKASFSAEELEKVKEQIHTEALKEYSGKLNLESNEIVAKRLQKEGEALINKLNEQYDISEFKTDKCEYGFDNYPFHKGKREYLLSGKIDRIDKWQDNVVLLDYKTGNISLKFADIYYGKKLQLLLYANAVKESLGNLHISGFGYYPIHDKYNREDDSKNNVIDGYFEKNDDIITRLDKNLFTSEEGVSTKSNMYSISRRINKGDKNTKYSSNVIDTTDLLALCDYASKVAKQALSEIEEGYIEPKPIIDGQKSPCEYCPFLSICNKELFALERVEEKITLQNIKEAMQNVQTNA